MNLPSTHWTMLAQATLHGDTSAGQALATFCQRYREPIMAMIRSRGMIESRLEDLTHDFLLQLMRNSSLRRVDPAKGRFRQFLHGALTNFLSDDAQKTAALKRGGGVLVLSLDAADGLVDRLSTPLFDETAMDREWALHLMSQAVQRVALDWNTPTKAARFEVLRQFLPGMMDAIPHEEAARRMGLSATGFRTELSRLRVAFRVAVRAEIAATVDGPEQIEEELSYLLTVLRAPDAPG
jgi:DNA-directed RNA polymerase specialized sigma24 family protein